MEHIFLLADSSIGLYISFIKYIITGIGYNIFGMIYDFKLLHFRKMSKYINMFLIKKVLCCSIG